MIVAAFSLLAAALCICAHGWWRAARAAAAARKARADEAWMHASCLSIAEGATCVETDAAVQASPATQAVFRLRWRHDAAVSNMLQSFSDANELAICVRDYIKQMDSYSMKLGEQPCALSRERAAIQRHDSLSKCQNSPLSSTASSSNSPSTPTPLSTASAGS